MENSEKQADKSAGQSKIADDTSVGNSEKQDAGRRLEDTILAKGLKRNLNLERRIPSIDRRAEADPNYKGPVRRYTIDPRANVKDRRDEK